MHFNRREPLAELIFITLSLQTAEPRYRQTYKALRMAFPTWSRLACANVREVARVIRDGGLSVQKARHIVAMLRAIKRAFGVISLAPLRASSSSDAEDFLCDLPGVGIKTARCVGLYCFGWPVFPIDVHCWRILKRMGLHTIDREKPTRREADMLQTAVPRDLRHDLHIGLVSLGRAVCFPRNPNCRACPVRSYCRHGLSNH
jgi:endonuclease III